MFQKRGVGTPLYYNGSAVKSHSTTTPYRLLRRLVEHEIPATKGAHLYMYYRNVGLLIKTIHVFIRKIEFGNNGACNDSLLQILVE